MNNKADVMGVLTQSEREDIAGGNEQDHLRSSAYDNIETILKARLTDLQSAHDVEVKELERKIFDININDLSVKTCVFFNRMDNESCAHIDVKKANTPVYWNAEEKQKYQKDSDNALCRNCECTLKQGMKYMQSEITQSVRDAFKEEGK
jgi:sucrose-6-phosphate hydrolase SacC (GH32 family)